MRKPGILNVLDLLRRHRHEWQTVERLRAPTPSYAQPFIKDGKMHFAAYFPVYEHIKCACGYETTRKVMTVRDWAPDEHLYEQEVIKA